MIQIASEDLAYIKNVCLTNKIEPNVLLAVIDVESNGVLFADVAGTLLPVIRWEGHYFDRLVPAEKRAAARKAGLAGAMGIVKNPASQVKRYDMLEKAAAIDEEAAYSSVSIGIGQVMGAHANDLGYDSAKAMFDTAKQGLSGQIELMLRYIVNNNLIDELQRKDWSAFARGYNGPAYKKNGYHLKLKAAYESYTGPLVVVSTPPSTEMLRMGSMGARVRELQQLLTRADVVVKVDGDFGPATKKAVEAFQKKNKLAVDGVAGPETMAVLLTYKTAPDEKPGKIKPLDVPAVQTAAGLGALGFVVVSLRDLFFNNWLLVGGLVIVVVAGAWAWDAYNKANRTYEGTE